MKRIILINIFVFFYSVYSFSQNIEIFFYDNAQKEFYKAYFQLNDFSYTEEESFIKLSLDFSLLKKILQMEKLKIDIIQNNIRNETTTKTIAGEPFYRQYVEISSDGQICIKEDRETEGRIVYDPTHPDSQKAGQLIGYVIYPNVFLENEYYDLFCSKFLFNSIVEYIQRNNLAMLVEKIPINSLEELHYLQRLEKCKRFYEEFILKDRFGLNLR